MAKWLAPAPIKLSDVFEKPVFRFPCLFSTRKKGEIYTTEIVLANLVDVFRSRIELIWDISRNKFHVRDSLHGHILRKNIDYLDEAYHSFRFQCLRLTNKSKLKVKNKKIIS